MKMEAAGFSETLVTNTYFMALHPGRQNSSESLLWEHQISHESRTRHFLSRNPGQVIICMAWCSHSSDYEGFALLDNNKCTFRREMPLASTVSEYNPSRQQARTLLPTCFILVLVRFNLLNWRWRKYVPPKRQLTLNVLQMHYIPEDRTVSNEQSNPSEPWTEWFLRNAFDVRIRTWDVARAPLLKAESSSFARKELRSLCLACNPIHGGC